ncbi:unnamed protein product [Clavelina lepadiformis]|uniref:Lipocalin/cytosolic fatty-acid binding domain-containing protein n=1 Tax=Clavelina lepadiformis TaxID=159417 RepID=A0ABP0F7F6_CLALP
MTGKFNGLWKLKSNENADELMARLDNGFYTCKSITRVRNFKTCCRMGIWFDEECLDGRRTKSIIKYEDGMLIQIQKWKGKQTYTTAIINDNDEMVAVIKYEDIVCRRTFKRLRDKIAIEDNPGSAV